MYLNQMYFLRYLDCVCVYKLNRDNLDWNRVMDYFHGIFHRMVCLYGKEQHERSSKHLDLHSVWND